MNDRKGIAYDSGDSPGTFESGRCAGCGVLLDDAGIMAEPDDHWVRLARGPWEQESCGERTLPLSYWRLMTSRNRASRDPTRWKRRTASEPILPPALQVEPGRRRDAQLGGCLAALQAAVPPLPVDRLEQLFAVQHQRRDSWT